MEIFKPQPRLHARHQRGRDSNRKPQNKQSRASKPALLAVSPVAVGVAFRAEGGASQAETFNYAKNECWAHNNIYSAFRRFFFAFFQVSNVPVGQQQHTHLCINHSQQAIKRGAERGRSCYGPAADNGGDGGGFKKTRRRDSVERLAAAPR